MNFSANSFFHVFSYENTKTCPKKTPNENISEHILIYSVTLYLGNTYLFDVHLKGESPYTDPCSKSLRENVLHSV